MRMLGFSSNCPNLWLRYFGFNISHKAPKFDTKFKVCSYLISHQKRLYTLRFSRYSSRKLVTFTKVANLCGWFHINFWSSLSQNKPDYKSNHMQRHIQPQIASHHPPPYLLVAHNWGCRSPCCILYIDHCNPIYPQYYSYIVKMYSKYTV